MQKVLRHIALLGCLFAPGCALLPQIAHQPTVHNPFPQLSKVAVAPFFNQSNEPTVDGRRIALAYFNELQLVPGFEVVPVEVVEKAMLDHRINMRGPTDARLLAQILGVDAVVVGAITDYSPYYPPRIALHVEWYAANPNFHPIPPGYGLPWGSPEERDIPAPLVFEAEMALAKAQLKTQTPPYEKLPDNAANLPLSYQSPAGKTPAGKLTADKIPTKMPADKASVEKASAETAPADKTAVDKASMEKAGRWKRPRWIGRPRADKLSWPRARACRRTGPIHVVLSRRRRADVRRLPVPATPRCFSTRGPTTATTWSLPRRCRATISSATTPALGGGRIT